jgi:hypothetical protein
LTIFKKYGIVLSTIRNNYKIVGGINMDDKNDNKISINMVISGKAYSLSFPSGQKMIGIVESTLSKTGNVGQPLENWELRDEIGTFIDLDKHLRDYSFQDNVTLFLNTKAGIGG